MDKKTLNNNNVAITFDGEAGILGRDKTDQFNLPTFYNRNKRGIAKAWAELERNFNEGTKFYDAIDILNKFNLKIHSYCAMD